MIKKLNPLTWLTRAMDATDEWMRRLDYCGGHWAGSTA